MCFDQPEMQKFCIIFTVQRSKNDADCFGKWWWFILIEFYTANTLHNIRGKHKMKVIVPEVADKLRKDIGYFRKMH